MERTITHQMLAQMLLTDKIFWSYDVCIKIPENPRKYTASNHINLLIGDSERPVRSARGTMELMSGLKITLYNTYAIVNQQPNAKPEIAFKF